MAITQRTRFSGRVTDGSGVPVPYVRVSVANARGEKVEYGKGNYIETRTDSNGAYGIQIPVIDENILGGYLLFQSTSGEFGNKLIKLSRTDKVDEVIVGGGSQDPTTMEEIVVIGVKDEDKECDWKCKLMKRKWLVVGLFISAIILAILIGVLRKKNNG
jgi:hypothetical protein